MKFDFAENISGTKKTFLEGKTSKNSHNLS